MPQAKIRAGRVRPAYIGDYDSALAYVPLDRVTFNGGVFECIKNSPAGEQPTSANWMRISDDLSSLVAKKGERGVLEGYETAFALSGSQTITIDSPDCINLATSGAVKLTFVPAMATTRAVKAISITADATSSLSIEGAVWQNRGEAPEWGTMGSILVLLAHFVGGRVVLSVADNTEE